ncbi:hypothetical protein HJB86_28840 [Rhizobium sp. NZLR3b]|uniref:hypothetical protein n=1 Tax=unclassified Rhizobium TaxID=2613769 RepID=UPI001C82C126|nr:MULTISPECIES: hypothetical protein [unclassified Rhizobium]MBX5157989.1 hypothetical protein [Rhizobium sp. NZLR8]MBX5192846.1 hypothetical protein [Rhizobium sp. NZLR3b]
MQRLLLSGLALAALAGTAFAQQPPAPPPAGAPPVAADPASPPPPPPPPASGDNEPMTGGPDARPGDRPDDRWHGSRGDMGFRDDRGFRGHRPPPPPPSKAAHFRIEDGDTRIDLKCAEDEPMKACADLLLQVMDRLQGQN